MSKRYPERGLVIPRKVYFWTGFFLFFCAAIVLTGLSKPSQAQSLPNLSSDSLNQLRQQFGQQGGSTSGVGDLSNGSGYQNSIIQAAPAPVNPPLAQSRLEQIMSARAGTKLEQFGYEQLGHGSSVAMAQTGAVPDDYVLGPGDQIVVTLRGQENSQIRVDVNRDGQAVLPRLNPIAAIGRTFGSFRQDLQAGVRRAYVATDASASVSRVRQISVLVSGEVNIPGQRLLTGLSSAVDAIFLSGGVKKAGSLRNVRIQRAGKDIAIDLYALLTSDGRSTNLRLADGDRIIVPSLGRTVAVAGLVRRPGIFELLPGQSSMSTRNLLALAGGQEVRGSYRLSVLQIDQQGRSVLASLAPQSGTIRESEILFVQLGADQTANQAILSGGTGLAGQYPIVSSTHISDVLKAPGALGPAPYTLFGIIARKDRRTLLRHLAAFTPLAVMGGSEDQLLEGDDIIRVFSVNEIRLLSNTVLLYRQRQDLQQQAIRNPLAAQDQAAPAALPGQNPAAGAGVMAQASSGTSNAPSSIADMQRADIAKLSTVVDPVTTQGINAQIQVQQQQKAQQQEALQEQAQLNSLQMQQFQSPYSSMAAGTPGMALVPATPMPPNSSQINPQFPPAGTDPATASGNAVYPRPAPALNFESADVANGQIASNREIRNFADLARQLNVDQLVLVNFLMDHQVVLNGAVSGPGSYFVGPGVALQDLVQAAGGTARWADESGVELITTAVDTQSGHSATRRTTLPLQKGTLANYVVRPGDAFRFNQVFTDTGLGSVTVQGEVRFTGSYQIVRGEHLSDLLARAGGVTNTAYPAGTVFLRKSAAQSEHEGYIRAAAEIENQLVVAMTRIGNDKIDPGTFASMQAFVNELRNQKAVGRIAIVADPSVLASKPELDPLLEPGDVVYIPQRPTTVSVLGQVMQPGSFPYRPGFTLADYIEQAGGYAATSDSSLTFVVLPDGSARRVQKSWLSFDAQSLPPGSTIVVPRDVTPLDARQLILDVSQIFSQLAVSIASVAVISR